MKIKKLLRILGIVLLVFVLLGAGAFTFINYRGIPKYKVEKIDYQAKSSPEIVARGKKLTAMLCAQCHLNRQTGKLTGQVMLEADSEFGMIYSPNITQDQMHGIGTWTDSELLYLLRTGIKRDGQYVPPYMAKLNHMADADVNAIIAFLRSDDPWVEANATHDRSSQPSFLAKFLSHVAWTPMEMPQQEIPMPDPEDKLALGRYLAINLECFSCHSASFRTNDYVNPEKSKGFFGGGNALENKEGLEIISSNLTPHPTGIGEWSEEKFIKVLRSGVKGNEPALRYPMLPYPQLTEQEASAIYTYLQTLDPIDQLIERKFSHREANSKP